MTPFGAKVRALRRARGLTLKQMAGTLDISQAYLSALEHGHRGLPSPALVVQICEYFGLIWDDFEEMHRLVGLSHPKVTVDTSGLDANEAFAKAHGFGGTPVIVRPSDGAVLEGFRPAAALRAFLSGASTPSITKDKTHG
jgi:transcriptional regulator with XRE-family HTH domain